MVEGKHFATGLIIGTLLTTGAIRLSAETGEAPLVTLHLSFEKDNWVQSAAGCADCFSALAQAVPGHIGNAALIENVSQSAVVEAPYNLTKTRGTLTLWYKPTRARTEKAYFPLFWCGEISGVGGNSFWLWMCEKTLRFDVRDPQDRYCTASTADWKEGQWIHIAAVWDCEKGLSLWVNGQKRAERETTWKPVFLSPLLIGTGNAPCEGRAAGGALDELKVFDRPLTPAQIQADFAESLPLIPAPIATAAQIAALKKSPPPREREPLETLFHLDFDNGFTAVNAHGDKEPSNANRPTLVPGLSGKAAQFGPRQSLRYKEEKNLRKECGAVAAWVQLPCDAGDVKNWLQIFREEGPNKAGENALWLWFYPQHGLRWDPRDAADSNVILGSSTTWKKDEWHHVIACWDALRGTSVFIDGKLRSFGSSGDSGKKFIPISWEPISYPAFIVGADNASGSGSWQGAIDEFKIFSRPLTVEEARTEYGRFCAVPIEAVALDPCLWAGERETLTLSLENLKGAALRANVRYAVKNTAGTVVAQGDLGQQMIATGKPQHAQLKMTLPEKGTYALTVTVDTDAGSRTFANDIRALNRVEQPARDAAHALITVAEVDAAALAGVIESAPSKVVDSPLGAYREAGESRNDRFALTFKISEPHTPHLAVVTYPDDKPRTLEVMLQPLDAKNDYQAQTGVFTGDEYPLSHALQEQKIVFWPQCTNMSFIFMTAEKGRPAAVKSLKIYKLEGGFPRLAVKPFVGSVPAREIGLYHEDPVFADCYGTLPDNPDMHLFPQFETVIDRMLDYHQSFGMSTVHYPVSWYHGPLFGSEAEPLTDFGGRPHPAGYPKYLMRRLASRGMTFNAWLHLHQIDSLLPYTITDDDRVRNGEETVINMRFDNRLFFRAWHGRDPVYNPLDPHVQETVKRQFAEIAARYGDEPALNGLTLNTVRHSIFAFGSLDSGYNDVNLVRFQKETGIQIPVDRKDRFRFAKSYRWLMANAKEPWIQWRCRKLHDYYKELAGLLRAQRKDLTLGIVIFAAEDGKATADYLCAQRPLEWAREQGIDPTLYTNDPEIVFRYSMVPADLRWRRGHGSTEPEVYAVRTVDSAPEIVTPITLTPSASVNMHDRYFENDVARKSPLKGLSSKTTECGWRVSALNGNSIHGLENHIFALNNLDALTITKGGFLVGTFGIEDKIGRFAKAYRALPAVKFDDVIGLADPVRVRQKVVDGSNFFYVLNRLPYPVDAEIRLEGAEAVDLVSDVKSAAGKLSLRLRPYDLRAFRQADDSHAKVLGGSAAVSAEQRAEFAEEVKTADALFREKTAKGADLSSLEPYLEKAKKCLADKEYARLYFLLQETWAQKLK